MNNKVIPFIPPNKVARRNSQTVSQHLASCGFFQSNARNSAKEDMAEHLYQQWKRRDIHPDKRINSLQRAARHGYTPAIKDLVTLYITERKYENALELLEANSLTQDRELKAYIIQSYEAMAQKSSSPEFKFYCYAQALLNLHQLKALYPENAETAQRATLQSEITAKERELSLRGIFNPAELHYIEQKALGSTPPSPNPASPRFTG